MLRIFGVERVSILADGLEDWRRGKLPLERGVPEVAGEEFNVRFDPQQIKRLTDVLLINHEGSVQIVNARPMARFSGQIDEPRPGLRRGHIPDAPNVPRTELVIGDKLKTVDRLNDIFLRQSVDFERPVVAGCGSGMTAAMVMLALTAFGVNGVRLYDGSWSEQGAWNDLPIEPAPTAP